MQAYLVLLHLALLHITCCVFYKRSARASTSKRITSLLSVTLALLQWSGTKLAVSPKCACVF